MAEQPTNNIEEPSSLTATQAGKNWLRWIWQLIGPLVALASVFLLFAVADSLFADDTFRSWRNIRTLIVDNSIIAVAALGMTVIIIARGIDLSAGTALALCATTLAWGLHQDVAFLATHGSNFTRSSEAWRESQQNVQSAEKQLANAEKSLANAQRTNSPHLERYENERNQQVTAIEEAHELELVAREQVKSVLLAKQDTAARNLAAAESRKDAASDRGEMIYERRLRQSDLIKRKLENLEDPNFQMTDDPEWYQGVSNAFFSGILALGIGLLTGVLAGVINGVLISKLNLAPFIVTLGTMTIFVGIGNLISGNSPIRPTAEQRPEWMMSLLSMSESSLIFGLPWGVWMVALMAISMTLVLRFTVFGRYVFAIGSNEATARLCGVNVSLYKIIIYAIGGLFLGIAGVYLFATVETGNPMDGIGRELKIIAAVVIGGGSLNGGRGAIIGSLAGVGIMAVIDSGCDQLGLADQAERIILGAVIIGAVVIDQLRRRGSDEN